MIPAGILNQGSDDAMIMEVRVAGSGVGMQASIYPGGTVNAEVDWGDGFTQTITNIFVVSHSYAFPGTYMVKITGSMTGWGSTSTQNKDKVYAIHSWGNLELVSLASACQNMVNIEYVAKPPATVTNTSYMFYGATNFNGDISGWDVSNVTNMAAMFVLASSFNGDISGWDVGNVTNMMGTFQHTTNFNGDISGWDVSNVTNMTAMFLQATAFNQDLSGWCVTNISYTPTSFDLITPAWTLPKPVWGTCPTPAPTPVLTSITVNPSTFEVSTGSARQLVVTANYSSGSPANITNNATYSSSNSSVAAVNSTGLVSGVSQGSATINISYEGETTSSSATVTVPATLTSISVSPTSASIQVGYGRQLTVTAHYSDSSQVNITSLASYTRTNTRITVNSTGLVTANTQGASGVDISYQGYTTSMSVTVTVPTVTSISISPSSISMSVGGTRQLTVTAHYSDSSTANVTSSASYGTSNSSRATVSSSGLVTAGSSTGSVNITATYGGWSDGINVNVTAATVTSLSISPTSFSITQGQTQQLSVTAHMSDSSTQNVTYLASYSSNQTGRATVNSAGLVTASNSSTGAVNITASYQGYSAISNGTITAATVNSISVSPTSVSLPMGRTQQLTVTAHLSNGGTQTVTSSASYSSNNTGRATVSGGGLITAGNTTGAATITITYSGKSTTMTSTTTAAVVDSISVSPTSFSIAQGLTQQLTVTATMSNGSNQNVTSSASYSSNQTGRATVSSTGLVTASGSTGTVNITATYGGQSAISSGTVTTAVVNSISVSPTSFSVKVGSTQQLTVTAAMSNGTNQNVTSSATYTRTNSNITVSSSGLVTGSSVGSSGVNISYGGASTATTGITITANVTLQSMAIEPSSIWMPGGGEGNQSFSVRGAYSDGSNALISTDVITAFMDFNDSTVTNIAIEPSGPTTFRVYQEGPPYSWSGVSYWDLYYFGSEGSPIPVKLVINVL